MLVVKNYTQEYLDDSRSKISELISAYKKMVAETGCNGGLDAFEPLFFNHMVLALDHYFNHRGRTQEKKDGNPLNEVRILCDSIMDNNNKMSDADKTIKYDPEKSVLKYNVGDEIKLNEKNFEALSKAFFTEIEKKFVNS